MRWTRSNRRTRVTSGHWWRFRSICRWQRGVPDPLPQVKKPIAPGQEYQGTGKLVRRLQFLGDLPAALQVPENSQSYSGDVVEGVKRFQTRHGLEASGKLGPQTITELNRPMSERVEALRLTLERWRWIPDNFTQPPILVNIPEFVLRAFDSLTRRGGRR